MKNYINIEYWPDKECWIMTVFIDGKPYVEENGDPPLLLFDDAEGLNDLLETYKNLIKGE